MSSAVGAWLLLATGGCEGCIVAGGLPESEVRTIDGSEVVLRASPNKRLDKSC